MDYQEFSAVVVALLTMCLVFLMLVMFELRVQAKQRDDAVKLLILSLFRMSKQHVKATEEQTTRLVEALRTGARIDVSALVEEGGAETEAVAEDEAEEAARSGERGRRAG